MFSFDMVKASYPVVVQKLYLNSVCFRKPASSGRGNYLSRRAFIMLAACALWPMFAQATIIEFIRLARTGAVKK
ncbi:MAG: hypothetical protein WBN40_02965 [Pseudomonadales bacterium]